MLRDFEVKTRRGEGEQEQEGPHPCKRKVFVEMRKVSLNTTATMSPPDTSTYCPLSIVEALLAALAGFPRSLSCLY